MVRAAGVSAGNTLPMTQADSINFVRYAFDLLSRRIVPLVWVRMEMLGLVSRMERIVPPPVLPESTYGPTPRIGRLPEDPAVRSLALLTLAEPMADALAETVAWLDREVAYRQRKGLALLDFVGRAHRARTALEAYRHAVKPAAENKDEA